MDRNREYKIKYLRAAKRIENRKLKMLKSIQPKEPNLSKIAKENKLPYSTYYKAYVKYGTEGAIQFCKRERKQSIYIKMYNKHIKYCKQNHLYIGTQSAITGRMKAKQSPIDVIQKPIRIQKNNRKDYEEFKKTLAIKKEKSI